MPGLHLQLLVVEGFPETPESTMVTLDLSCWDALFLFFLAPGNISMTPNILTMSWAFSLLYGSLLGDGRLAGERLAFGLFQKSNEDF